MQYQQNITVLQTVTREVGGHHALHKLFSNGTFVRDERGCVVFRPHKHRLQNHCLLYELLHERSISPTLVRGVIKDDVLASRICTYLETYYKKYVSNCSAFAHYLKTGVFLECTSEQHFILDGSMTSYVGQEIGVGDMLCIIYYSPIYHSRRESNKLRELYRANKKLQALGTSFLDIGRWNKQVVWTAEEMRKRYFSSGMSDYHFVTCVAHRQGVPVFIQQSGVSKPKTGSMAPVMFTLGGFDPYADSKKPPFMVFLQRRHTR